MRRLNFASRKTEGIDLAQAVSRSLSKRYLANASTKRKEKASDPEVKLDISNRRLTDEGFEEVINTLLQCLQDRDCHSAPSIVRLMILNLKGNELTAESLPKLARAISLSAEHLEDLDLSDNQIKISSDSEKKDWRLFLASFKNCFMLKRLNLGGNPLGTPGIEILAKTYIESPLYIGVGDRGNAFDNACSARVKQHAHGGELEAVTSKGSTESSELKVAMEREQFSRQHGLRSVPYFILSNIQLTKIALIHLSSMVSVQMPRGYLRKFLPDTKAVMLSDEVARNCHSIIWLPNETLHSSLRELLHCATSLMTPPPAIAEGSVRTLQSPKARARSIVPKTNLHGAHGYLLKTVLVAALQEEGTDASDLWTAACNMLKLRTLLENESGRLDFIQPSLFPHGLTRGTPEFDRNFPPLIDHTASPSVTLFDTLAPGVWNRDLRVRTQDREHWLRMPARKQLSLLAHAVDALGVLTMDQQEQLARYIGQWDVAWDQPLDKRRGQQLASFLEQVGCVSYRTQEQKNLPRLKD